MTVYHPKGAVEKSQAQKPLISADCLQLLPGIPADTQKDHSGSLAGKPKQQKIPKAEKAEGGQCTHNNI